MTARTRSSREKNRNIDVYLGSGKDPDGFILHKVDENIGK